MPFAFEGVQPTQVPMTPDRTVIYDAHRIDSLEATLYTADGCSPDAVEKVIHLSLHAPRWFKRPVGVGSQGSVYQYGDQALKIYLPGHGMSGEHGLSNLRANVTLAEGLERVGELEVVHDGVVEARYNYSSPAIHAALIPDFTYGRDVQAVWSMDFIDGEEPLPHQMPDRDVRTAHFEAAVGACGLGKKMIGYDDYPGNTIKPLGYGPGTKDLSKLDVGANSRFDF